jgi:excisionase family DNA binding protein
VLIRSAVLLDGRECRILVQPLADAVRRSRDRGDRIDAEFEALVNELAVVGRAWRAATSADGSSELPPPVELVDAWDIESRGVTTREAGERLLVSPRQVRNLVRAGTLDGRKVGPSWRITNDSLERLAEDRGRERSGDACARAA